MEQKRNKEPKEKKETKKYQRGEKVGKICPNAPFPDQLKGGYRDGAQE